MTIQIQTCGKCGSRDVFGMTHQTWNILAQQWDQSDACYGYGCYRCGEVMDDLRTQTRPQKYYVVINADRDFWSSLYGWCCDFYLADWFADKSSDLPIGGHWLHIEGLPTEVSGYLFKHDENGDHVPADGPEDAVGYSVFVSVYNGDERTDVPTEFERDFPGSHKRSSDVRDYLDELYERFGEDVNQDFY